MLLNGLSVGWTKRNGLCGEIKTCENAISQQQKICKTFLFDVDQLHA